MQHEEEREAAGSGLERIEAKVDLLASQMAQLLEALDQEEDEEAATVITTMDGERLELPSGADTL